MRGIWLVINHKALRSSDRYQGFTDPRKAQGFAQGLGWREEIPGSFNDNPNGPHTHLDGKVHVTIQFIPIEG